MNRYITTVLLTLTPVFCFASGRVTLTKSEALQLSKNRIETLSQTFALISYTCFVYEKDCGLDTNLLQVTVKLINDEFEENPPKIEYASGSDKFMIDGALRVAKTGNTWGVPVIFNEDLLTRETNPGNFQALDFFEIFGILVHEYGHHQETFLKDNGMAFLEHQELDEMAMKVVTYVKDRTRQIRVTQDEVPTLPLGQEVNIYQIDVEQNIGIRMIWSNIFIDSLSQTIEVSQSVVAGLACPKTYQSGHLTFIGEAYNAGFANIQAPRFNILGNVLQIEQEIGDASVLCVDRNMGVYNVFNGYKNGLLRYYFEIKDNLLIYSQDSTFTATPPPDKNYE
ncbi:MAG: hypothetical protein ACXVB4_17110 [Pseudobdellovibrionaceae bacterium]